MNLQGIIDRLNLTVLTDPRDFTLIQPDGGYTSDLLSCVMAGAKNNYLWITLQAHLNIVAVAALLDVADYRKRWPQMMHSRDEQEKLTREARAILKEMVSSWTPPNGLHERPGANT